MYNQAIARRATLKLEAEEDGLFFARYFFKHRFGSKMIISNHHRIIQNALDRVLSGEITRLIINLPPGYTKTELAVISFMARGLALNPKSKFMHLSYSDNLALQNSTVTREIVKSEKFRELWPLHIKTDTDSKKLWYTEEGGGVYATSAAGQVTGFRAGHMDPGFTGAVIIDDPVKPDDSEREERRKVNERYNSTVKSRLAHENIPVIVIMQRIHKNDLSGYLLRGGSGEKWYHLCLPVKTDGKRPYNAEYTHGIEIKTDIPGPWLWPAKHSEKHENALKAHKRTWFSQYLQRPEDYVISGGLWSQETIERSRVQPDQLDIDDLVYIATALDPSGDDGEEDSGADEIGLVSVARGINGHFYVLRDDTLNGSPYAWGSRAVKVYNFLKANALVYEKNYGGAMVKHTIQSVPGGDAVHLVGVTATKGKLLRAEPVAALYEQGRVHHVGAFSDLEEELTEYNGKGKSPNRLDALVWAITHLYEGAGIEQSAPEVQLSI